ncbi:MAG: polysaccharide pyruvyl transferase CsaB [Hormoscilla sp. GM102CHS1]|nr:polysaccharide pyruvyl transferase CsaB [Hormoscilla sp. GM102CHS1]
MEKIRAVLCGYYGKGNGGDEALLATLLQMLPENVTPLVLSGNPHQTQTRYGVETRDLLSAFQVLSALRASEIFIWGGGSLIQDATSALSPLYYSGLMGLAQQMGLKTIAWAQGIGPLQRPLTRAIARRAFAGCTAVSVRDRASAAVLQAWQIPYNLAPDPVWALDSKPVPALRDLPEPRVAVTLRPHPQLTPQRLDNLTRALVLFQQATDASILLLPFQPDIEMPIAQAIGPQLSGVSQIIMLEDPRVLKGVFQGVQMAIGMRLHAMIMAAAAPCQCFALSYDPKVDQLMAELALPGWQLAQMPEDPHLLSKTWLAHFRQRDPLDANQIQSLVDRAGRHRDLLHQVLAPDGQSRD